LPNAAAERNNFLTKQRAIDMHVRKAATPELCGTYFASILIE